MSTVLIAAMSLGIGGAETHIIELTGELISRSWSVAIVSAGGVYVDTALSMGARHYTAPLDTRDPARMLKALEILRKVIKKERPDVVHAHARIPAFLCGLLQKRMGFPFVTTCHGVYHVSGMLKLMSDWGQKTIAVSDDIREYLIESYGVRHRDIITTVNGIDTRRFAPKSGDSAVRSELGIAEDVPVIVHVSRLDDETDDTSECLLRILPALRRKHPGLTVIITGSGTKFEELRTRTESLNAVLGERAVIMTGQRTDIDEVVAAGDVFIGVSRAALEAMSACKPVVLCGHEGFIGLFGKNVADRARSTNFCCRGCGKLSDDAVLNSLEEALTVSGDSTSLRELAEYSRRLVAEEYSIRKMTDDTVAAYEAVRKKRWNVVMSGYFGFGNLGDEAILQTVHQSICSVSDEIDITVLSKNPAETHSRYGYRAINRFDLFKVRKALKNCSALVSGGGSLLQDHTSTRSLFYYLSIIRLARRYGKKVMIFANGIGPVEKPANRRRVRDAIESADVVTLRDPYSLTELREMGVTREDIMVTADPVFTMEPLPSPSDDALLREAGIPTDRPYMIVSVRNAGRFAEHCAEMADFCDIVCETRGLNIVFIVMQQSEDLEISEKIASLMRSPSCIVRSVRTTDALMRIIGGAEIALAMRLHTLIFAARCAVPTAGIIYDPKVEAYLRLLELPEAGSSAEFSIPQALEVTDALLKDRDVISRSLRDKAIEFADASRQDALTLLELLER